MVWSLCSQYEELLFKVGNPSKKKKKAQAHERILAVMVKWRHRPGKYETSYSAKYLELDHHHQWGRLGIEKLEWNVLQ